MNNKEIKELLEAIHALGLEEVTLRTDAIKLHVKRTRSSHGVAPEVPSVDLPVSSASKPVPSVPTVARSSSQKTIKSPMVGTFYRASSPEGDPFVQVGDVVKKGQTVCIIEAMKLFNEIESEQAGKVVEVLAENGQGVEYDQPLFVIE